MAMNIPAPVQILRGTKAEIVERTGKIGELNWAEDANELYMHDGTTKGGHLIGGGIYTGGDGISIDQNGKISLDVSSTFGSVSRGILYGGSRTALKEDIDTLDANDGGDRYYYWVLVPGATGDLPIFDGQTKSFFLVVLGVHQIALCDGHIAVRYKTGTSTGSTWKDWVYYTFEAGDGITNTDGVIAVDHTVVRTTGDQTIYGVKTFHQDIQIKSETGQNTTPQVDLIMHDITRGTAPAETRSCGIACYDKNIRPLGIVNFHCAPDGAYKTQLRVYNGTGAQQNVDLVYPASGNPYFLGPHTRSNPASNELVTVSYCQNNLVYLRRSDIYVDGTNGNDSNHGVSADKPVKTLQKAVDIRRTIATDMFVRINFKTAGTYTFDSSQWPDKTIFVGATDNRADTVVQIASCVPRDIYFEARNLTIEFTGSTVVSTSRVVCEPLRCGLYLINVTVKDSTTFSNPYTLFRIADNSLFFTENFIVVSQRSYGSLFILDYCSNFAPSATSFALQITGTVTDAVFNVLGGSYCRLPETGISNAGTLTGPRYHVAAGGVIDSVGLGEYAIPGTQPGVVADAASFYI